MADENKTVDPGSVSVGYTLYQMHSEPWWHKVFRCFVPRDEWPDGMKDETDDGWPECLPDGPEKDAHRTGLEKARRLMNGLPEKGEANG